MGFTEQRSDEFSRFTGLARGAVDTAVGLGVLGLQKLQVGRVELDRRLRHHDRIGPTYDALRAEAFRRASHLDAIVGEALRTVESSLQPVTGRLPEPARHVATIAQARIEGARSKVSRYLADAAREASTDATAGATSHAEADPPA